MQGSWLRRSGVAHYIDAARAGATAASSHAAQLLAVKSFYGTVPYRILMNTNGRPLLLFFFSLIGSLVS